MAGIVKKVVVVLSIANVIAGLTEEAQADCSSDPDLAQCFCSLSFPSQSIPAAYVGPLRHESKPGAGLDFFLVVEEVFPAEGVDTDYGIGDRIHLFDVPSHSVDARFLLYFSERVLGSRPALIPVGEGGVSIAVPVGYLPFRESFCRVLASAEDVAKALVSPTCRQTIRELVAIPSQAICSSDDGCSSGGSAMSPILAGLFVLLIGALLRRRRP